MLLESAHEGVLRDNAPLELIMDRKVRLQLIHACNAAATGQISQWVGVFTRVRSCVSPPRITPLPVRRSMCYCILGPFSSALTPGKAPWRTRKTLSLPATRRVFATGIELESKLSIPREARDQQL
eukprot:gene22843-biopygen8259